MARIGRELVGIIGALVAWWAVTVLVGLLLSALFPSFNTSYEIDPENLPQFLAGFVAALYAFRAVTARRD
jgi:hypothetical protein